MRRSRRGRDAGQVTVVLAGVIVAVLAVMLGAFEVVRAIGLAHRARSAADLAALAAARYAVTGAGAATACGQGASVAAANGAAVVGCAVGADGTVVVTVTVSAAAPWPRTARGSARAGPG